MKLSLIIGASLGAALAATAAVTGAIAHAAPSSLANALSLTLAAAGGPGVLCLVLYSVFSAALTAATAVYDLLSMQSRLAEGGEAKLRLPEAWHTALAGTAFATLAGAIARDDFAIMPFVVSRIVRSDVWRIFSRRLMAAQAVTLALAAAALVLAPGLTATPPVRIDAALRIDAFAACLLFAGTVVAWLLIERAIDRLVLTVTELIATSEAPKETLPLPSPTASIAATGAAQSDKFVAAVNRLAHLIDALNTRQSGIVDKISQALAVRIDAITRAAERAETAAADTVETLRAALTELAAKIENLAEPVAEHMKLTIATETRSSEVQLRQKEIVDAMVERWGELADALQTMGTGLGDLAAAVRLEEQARLPVAAPSAEQRTELGEELRELLDEMSDSGEVRD